MPEPLSPARLSEIRERANSATPGPWGVGNGTEIALDVDQTSPGCFSYTVKLASVVEDDDRQDDVYYLKGADQLRVVASAEDDALFIAHSRQDVEDLLAEVERLNALVKCLRSEAEREEQTTGNLIDERDNFHALLDRFAAAVAPIEVIGEHSSGNDPWLNALDMVTPAAEVDRLRAQVSLMGTYLQRESMAAIDKALAERMAGQ